MTFDPSHTAGTENQSTAAPKQRSAEAHGPAGREQRSQAVVIDRDRVTQLAERQNALLAERTTESSKHHERARRVMPAGVPSQFQVRDPWPIYIQRGLGAKVWDVDDNEYLDFHNGFGVMCVGHAHPKVQAAVKAQVERGTHFGAPTDHAVAVAEELRRRWKLPYWRFTNSGTESTMEAIQLARGLTGRELVIKIEGTYHGHHDTVMVSSRPAADAMGEREHPNRVPANRGIPESSVELTHVVPFNDADALERRLNEFKGQFACLIVEPAMMNVNVIKPLPGYLERVRELTLEHDVQFIFDEVKTGVTIAAGGAVEVFGVDPDIVCLAKAMCGGLPGGAIGMRDELAERVATGDIRQQGTFNGNPLVMAAAHAALTEVLTDDAYAQFEQANAYMMRECQRIIDEYRLPAYPVGIGAKGCIIFSSEPVNEYRDYLTKIDHTLTRLAWLYHMNNGIFMAPGEDEQWTLSVMHGEPELEKYIKAFEIFAGEVTA